MVSQKSYSKSFEINASARIPFNPNCVCWVCKVGQNRDKAVNAPPPAQLRSILPIMNRVNNKVRLMSCNYIIW